MNGQDDHPHVPHNPFTPYQQQNHPHHNRLAAHHPAIESPHSLIEDELGNGRLDFNKLAHYFFIIKNKQT